MEKQNSIVTLKKELEKNTSNRLNQLTQLSIIENEIPTLFEIKKLGKEEQLIDVMSIMLIDIAENINVNNTLTSQQIPKLAADIVRLYDTMCAEDIYLVGQRLVHGLYGTIYNLSPNIIHDAIRKYGEEKDLSIHDHNIKKHNIPPTELSDDTNKYIENILKDIDTRILNKRVAKEKKIKRPDKHPYDKFIHGVIHYHFLCNYKMKRVIEIIGQSEDDINTAIKLIEPYIIINEYKEVTRVLYDDIYALLKPDIYSKLKNLLKKLFD